MTEAIDRLRDNVRSVYRGDPAAVDRLIACLLARGHALIEDVPGVGKTLLATAIARSLDVSFSRVQLTPDMLPSDLIGVTVYDREGSRFEFRPGPIFANLVLADEVNRTTPRTQTALLEAMNEGAVTVDGVTRPLGPPFMVLATQNPYEFEGTYPLPENQLDRFLMRLSLGYPEPEVEAELLELRPAQHGLGALRPVLTPAAVLDLQERADAVRLSAELRRYVVAIAEATRRHPEVRVGVSPRGSLALAQAARATALMAGRDYAVPEDVLECVPAVLGHRLITREHGPGAPVAAAAGLLERVVESVPSPV